MITRKPQAAGVRPCESTAEIGRTTSNAKYTRFASAMETRKRRNALSLRMTPNEPRSGGSSGA
jgi:hypothetical protein